MTKVLILNDLHFGKSSESTTHPGIVRQANNEAKDAFDSLIPRFREIKPDLIAHLGDGIRDVHDLDIDSNNLGSALSGISRINAPTIHMLGNHELNSLGREEISSIYQGQGIEPAFFGVKDLGHLYALWLDLEIGDNGEVLLPNECRSWLDGLVIEVNKPILILSHYSLIPIDTKGIFYSEKKPQELYYSDSQEILSSLGRFNSRLHLNAHVHLITHQQIEDKSYISCPAFSDNIASPNNPDSHPGIYSTLEIENEKFVFTSYSHQFAFAKIQGVI